MQVEELKKLWVSCHLLYQNSSQARDVFHSIANRENIETTDFKNLLKHLYSYLKTHEPVKSASQYYEFSKNDLVNWNKTLLKCTEEEIFILMSILAHEVSLLDLSQAMRLPETKVRYLLNQSIRKVIKTFNINVENKKEIKLKEYGQNDVTNLFIHEHFAEYCLGLSSEDVVRKIELSKKEMSKYDQIKYEIHGFKNELKLLKVSDFFQEELQNLEKNNEPKVQHKEKLTKHKDKIFLAVLLLSFFAVMILRPSFLRFENLTDSNKKIILEEISLKKSEIAKTDDTLNTDSTDAVSETVVIANVEQNSNANKNSISTNSTLPTSSNIIVNRVAVPALAAKPNQKVLGVSVESEAKTSSGVYKGEMTVEDWEIVSKLIKDKIVEIGGTKAGEVELGWIKNKTTSYYHFIFPADKFDNLMAAFKQYGVVNYKFEAHPRKLAEGQKRFILEVHQGE